MYLFPSCISRDCFSNDCSLSNLPRIVIKMDMVIFSLALPGNRVTVALATEKSPSVAVPITDGIINCCWLCVDEADKINSCKSGTYIF
jgi:hypothetical protein